MLQNLYNLPTICRCRSSQLCNSETQRRRRRRQSSKRAFLIKMSQRKLFIIPLQLPRVSTYNCGGHSSQSEYNFFLERHSKGDMVLIVFKGPFVANFQMKTFHCIFQSFQEIPKLKKLQRISIVFEGLSTVSAKIFCTIYSLNDEELYNAQYDCPKKPSQFLGH